MYPETCPNCQHHITETETHCPGCGQKNRLPRLTTYEIAVDIFHSLTDARGLLHLIYNLVERPGQVAREFVQGKRRSYFPPFSFLILVVGVTSLLLGQSQVISQQTGQKMSQIGRFMDEHANIIIFLNVPILAFFNRVLFRRVGYNYAEHLVMAAFTSGLKSIFFSLLVVPFLYLFPWFYIKIVAVYMLCWAVYFAWANLGFTQRRGWKAFLLGLCVPILTQITTVLLVGGTMLPFIIKESMKK